MRSLRLAIAAVGVLGAVLVTAGPAVAAWVVTSTGAESVALAAALQPPTATTAAVTASSVTLSWTPPASGVTPSGYTVRRTAPTATVVCVGVAATTCADTGLSPSTAYTYEITSAVGPLWESTPVPVTATTSALTPSAFLVTAPATATAGISFSVTVQARDSSGVNDTTYTGAHTLTFSGPGTIGTYAPVYPASADFDFGGLATVTLTLFKAESVTITVADPAAPARTGISGVVAVAPRPGTKLYWTSDAAGLVDACPTGTVVVGPNGQRSWYVGILDQYGNRAVEVSGRAIGITRTGGTPAAMGTATPTSLTVAAGANPAVTSATTVLKLKKKTAVDTTFKAASNPLAAVSCTLALA